MSSWKYRAWAVVAVVAMGAVVAVQTNGARAATSHHPSGSRTLDPRHLPSHMPHGVFAVRTSVTSGTAKRSTNGLLASDLAIYVTDGSTFTSLAAEGHLALHNDTGHHYVGSFVDDLGSAKVYPAHGSAVSATTLNGKYTIATARGTFHFVVGGTFTSTVPSQYPSGSKIGTILYGAHAYTAHAPLTAGFGSFSIGVYHNPVTGTLNLTTDAIGYIVPFSSRRHVNSSWVYFSGGDLHTYRIHSYGRFYPPDGAGDGSLTAVLGIGKTGSVLFSVIDAHEDTSGQSTISGDALSGSGSSTVQSTFTAH